MFKFQQDIPFSLVDQKLFILSSITFSDDCTYVAINLLQEVKVYNLIIRQIEFIFHTPNQGQSLMFSQDNQYLACVGDGYQQIIIWNLKNDQINQYQEILDSSFNYRSFTFNKECKQLIYVNKLKQIIVWDLVSKKPISQFQIDPKIKEIQSLKINTNSQIVSILTKTNNIIFYDYKYSKRLLIHKLRRNQINKLMVSKDGQFLFLSGDMDLIQQYDIRSIRAKGLIKLVRQLSWINSQFYFSPQLSQNRSILLALRSNDIQFLIWNLETGGQIEQTLQIDRVTAYNLSQNQSLYLFINSQKIIKVFRKATNQ